MAGSEDLLTDAERLAITSGDELLAREVLKVETFIEKARTLGELAALTESLGLSKQASNELLVAFRERMEGIAFDPALELGRIFNNVAVLLPAKPDLQTDQAALLGTPQTVVAIGTTKIEMAGVVAANATPLDPIEKGVKKTSEAKYGIGSETALDYLESLTDGKYETFDLSKAPELADVIMDFAAIRVRKDNLNHKAILVGILEGLTKREIADRLHITMDALSQQKSYIRKKVLENPHRSELGPIIDKILSNIENDLASEALDQPSDVSSELSELEHDVPAATTDEHIGENTSEVLENKVEKVTTKKLNQSAYDYLAHSMGQFDDGLVSTDDAERLADFLLGLRNPATNTNRKVFPYKQALVYRFQNMTPKEIGELLGITGANVSTSLGNFRLYIETNVTKADLARLFQKAFGEETESMSQDIKNALQPKYVLEQKPTLAVPLAPKSVKPQPPKSTYIGFANGEEGANRVDVELDVYGQGALVKAYAEILDINLDLQDNLKNFLSLDTRGSSYITGEQKNRVVQRFRDMIEIRFKSFYNTELKLGEMEKVALTNTLGWACKDGKNSYFPGMLVSSYTHSKDDGRMLEREEAALGAYRKLAEAFERTRPRPAQTSATK